MVHGGGPQATELQKQLGQTPNIVAGRRVTDAATLDVMKMIVAGLVNVDLCAALVRAGCKPVGLHGASSGAIQREEAAAEGHRGRGAGSHRFRPRRRRDRREPGAPLAARHERATSRCSRASAATTSGQTYNINADTVANQVAVALDAKALVVVSDVPGVLARRERSVDAHREDDQGRRGRKPSRAASSPRA